MTGVNNKNMTIKLAEMYINRELVGDSDSNTRFFSHQGDLNLACRAHDN